MKKFMLMALTAVFALSVSAQCPEKKGDCCKKEKTECCKKDKKDCKKKKKACKKACKQQKEAQKRHIFLEKAALMALSLRKLLIMRQ